MGYTFKTKEEAEELVRKINLGEGIPRPFDSVTMTYCNAEPIYNTDDINVPIEDRIILGWSVLEDEITSKYYP